MYEHVPTRVSCKLRARRVLEELAGLHEAEKPEWLPALQPGVRHRLARETEHVQNLQKHSSRPVPFAERRGRD